MPDSDTASMLVYPTISPVLQQQPSRTQPCPGQGLARLPTGCCGSCGAASLCPWAQHPQPGTVCDRQTPVTAPMVLSRGFIPPEHPPTAGQPLCTLCCLCQCQERSPGLCAGAQGPGATRGSPCCAGSEGTVGQDGHRQGHCAHAAPGSFMETLSYLFNLWEKCLMGFIKCLSVVYALGLQEIKWLLVVSEGSKERVQEPY